MNQNLGKRNLFRIIIPSYPAFNIYSGIAKVTTALGPLYIGAAVNKTEGWDVEIIDENNYRRFGPIDKDGMPDHDALQKTRPADAVGFYGGLTSTIPRLYNLAEKYKKYGVKTIAGGQHFVGENIEEAFNNSLDFIVIGEGEQTIKELLCAVYNDDMPLEDIAGLAFLENGNVVKTAERELSKDFDKFPLPDFSLLRYADIKLYPVSWTRGCGMNCEFCTVKGKVRCPAPEYVVSQISSVVERHNARKFFLVDDLFGQNRKFALRLCELLEEYGKNAGVKLDITVQMRLDKSGDSELLAAMRKAGVTMVAIGFESPIPDELKAMNKKLKPEDMLEMTRLYHKAGFLIHGMFIFGYPLAGAEFTMPLKERVRWFRKFINKARIDTVQILLPVPLPGTEMTRRLAEENRIMPRDLVGWEYYDGNFPLFEPDAPLSPNDLQKAARKIMRGFYRFHYMFLVGFNILMFPAMIFSLFNIKFGWRKWYRYWRNDILRFAGWMVLRKWTLQFKKGSFYDELKRARERLSVNTPKPVSVENK